ncbi:hypothetical protein F5X68DRAFT_274548 [Plectosphaerella plurivora]|uniref:F-box domain-containing protein n=1 Tax=Plectosphaerella plurivora TaxID=936078 RepID=A0A9P8VH25_9PEZI|nr:hypothetical protein F5X68DRAFT_274548 [Plectosphaerella plurivora]
MTSFIDLPDDIIIEIITHLNTARDVAHLARTCQRLHLLGRTGGGWRAFVRSRFPSISPGNDGSSTIHWDALARKLADGEAAWDKRSFRPVALLASKNKKDNFFTGSPTFTHPYSPAVDAALSFGGTYEVVAWGAGETVVGRFKPVGSKGDRGEGHAWFRFDGARAGHKPVTGDVTAMKIVEPAGKLGMLVGRASGNLQLLSAASGNAGQVVASYALPPPPDGSKAASWMSVGYIDVLEGQETLVAGNRSTVCAFPMGTDDTMGPVQPLGSHLFLDPNNRPRFIHAARSLGGGESIACALGWDSRPLRWLTVTSTGFVPREIPGDPMLEIPLADKASTTIRALECVGSSFGPSRAGKDMLLTAWDDGTVRLFDPRAPTLNSAVYRDAFQPHEPASSLLSWGTNRFITGSNNMALVKIFDYRWPKGGLDEYRVSDAAPCSGQVPIPSPQGEPVDRASKQSLVGLAPCCDHIKGTRCIFHTASRTHAYRPNACLLLQPFPQPEQQRYRVPAQSSRVLCMAKSSDISSSFYIGLSGAVAEMRIGCSGGGVTPWEAVAAMKRGARTQEVGYCILETGRGRVEVTDGQPGMGINSYMPPLVSMRPEDEELPTPTEGEGARRHRWDKRFWRDEHFD